MDECLKTSPARNGPIEVYDIQGICIVCKERLNMISIFIPRLLKSHIVIFKDVDF